MKRRKLAALVAFLLIPGASGQGLPELGDSAGTLLPLRVEKRIGEEAYRNIRFRDLTYVEDAEVARYVSLLGGRLVAASPDRNQGFEFFVIQDPSINAFAMPGGYIGVHTGLLLAAQSESEIAGVLAHEVSHVTQRHIARMLGKQSDASIASIAALVLALIAARSSRDLAQATLATASAGAIQSQLNYSREFEREADRLGFQLLSDSGFDVHAMATFFERLQKAGRFYDNNAPAYLRTHPLSVERMSDIQNRAQARSYKQVPDSLDFHLVRAKLRAEQGDARDAVVTARDQLKDKRYSSEVASRFYFVSALLRDKRDLEAGKEMENLRALKISHPMIDLLGARLQIALNKPEVARGTLQDSISRYRDYWPLRYALVKLLQDMGHHVQALSEADEMLKMNPKDAQIYAMQAKSYAATGQQFRLHQALAEQYYLMGTIPGAIEQLLIAKKRSDGDFYQLSVLEARLRELQTELMEKAKSR